MVYLLSQCDYLCMVEKSLCLEATGHDGCTCTPVTEIVAYILIGQINRTDLDERCGSPLEGYLC